MARILHADDEITARRVARWALENDGHQVTDVDGGKQAVRSAIEDRPDLILLDRRMPDLDGLDVLRALRGNETTRHIPVIMITSVQEPRDVGDVLQEGVAAYVMKPYEREKLVRAVNRALTRQGETAGVEEPTAARSA
jgi:chemosensory pili system protein ChpA (sensor histidine kinase/response regulator)